MPAGSTLVVVADGAVARFLSRMRPGARLVELVDKRMDISEIPAPRDHASRVHHRIGAGSHTIGYRLTPHEAAETAFLERAAQQLMSELRREEVGQLVLCGPPKALGVLRDALPADARERLVLSWSKDITRETPAEIDDRLRALKA